MSDSEGETGDERGVREDDMRLERLGSLEIVKIDSVYVVECCKRVGECWVVGRKVDANLVQRWEA